MVIDETTIWLDDVEILNHLASEWMLGSVVRVEDDEDLDGDDSYYIIWDCKTGDEVIAYDIFHAMEHTEWLFESNGLNFPPFLPEAGRCIIGE